MNAFLNFDAETGCLSLQGELTIYEANVASDSLCKAFSTGQLKRVDLSGVTEIDTAGLQILLMARSLRTSCDQSVTLVNHSETLRDLLELTGLELMP